MINNICIAVFAFFTTRLAAFKEERGQDLVEYAVLVGAIGIVVALALFAFPFGDVMDTFASRMADCIEFSPDCGNF